MIGLVSRSKRRYGGYIVHVGIALMFLGFAGEGFKQEGEALLKPGEQFKVAHFTVKHDALRVTSEAQKQMITGHVSVLRRRQADRHDGAREVVLCQAGGGADHGGRDSPQHQRGLLHRARRIRRRRTERDVRGDGQSAGQLDLARLRRHGARHRSGADARVGAGVRRREGAVRRRDGVDDPAAVAAAGRDPRANAAGGACRPAQAARRGDPLHLQLPAADERLPDGAQLPRPRRPARQARQVCGGRRGWTAIRCSPRSRATMAPRRFSRRPIDRASIGSPGSSRISLASPAPAPPS